MLLNSNTCWKDAESILSSMLFETLGGNGITGAIAGGVAAGAALLFAAPAIAFAWWRRRKPQEFFFDVPGQYMTQWIPLQISNFFSFMAPTPFLPLKVEKRTF